MAGRALESLSPVIEDADANIEVNALPRVVANETQIGQVVHNLLDNALKYRAKDRRLFITIRTIKPSARNYIAIEVSDNGIGFDPEFADRIFGMFERLHGREEYSGTGMGLAHCKRIVEQHGGMIHAHSEPGVGSRFVLEFPICEPGACIWPGPEVHPAHATNLSILVAEDDETTASSWRKRSTRSAAASI